MNLNVIQHLLIRIGTPPTYCISLVVSRYNSSTTHLRS